jgi:sugar phosphate permease
MGDNKSFIHWGWIILTVCFVNLFINYSVRLGYGVVLPEMIRTLHFGRTAGGTIYNAYLMTYIVLTPFTGYLTDRYGARRVITLCTLVLGIGVTLMGRVQSLWAACFFFAIVGVGATGMWTPVITLVQRWFSQQRRGLALGILSTGYGLGFATMGALFPWIVHQYSWRFAWYVLGGMAFVMIGINGLTLRSSPESCGDRPWGLKGEAASVENPAKKSDMPISVLFRSRNFWCIGLSYGFISYSLYGITTFMVDYAKYQLELSLEKASFLATIHGVCQIVGVLTILPLSDYLGRKKTIMISNAFITLALLGILFTGKSWVMLYVLVGFTAVFYGVTFPIYGACGGDYFPKEIMGTVIGAWTPFYGLGAILTHWVTGLLRDFTGVYNYGFAINVLAAAIGFFLITRVRKRHFETELFAQGRH